MVVFYDLSFLVNSKKRRLFGTLNDFETRTAVQPLNSLVIIPEIPVPRKITLRDNVCGEKQP